MREVSFGIQSRQKQTTLTAFDGALLGLGVGSLEIVGEIVGELEGEALGLDEGQRRDRGELKSEVSFGIQSNKNNTVLTAFEGLDVGLRVGSFDTVGEIVGELEGDPVGLSEGEWLGLEVGCS